MSDPQFFAPARSTSAGELAEAIGASLLDQRLAGTLVDGVASIHDGRPGTVVYADGIKQSEHLARTQASVVICPPDTASSVRAGVAVMVSGRPQESFVRAAAFFFPAALRPGAQTGETGVSPAAHVSPSACLEPGVVVEAGAVICAGAAIGSGTVVAANAVVGANCRIGRDCHIGFGASVQFALIGNRVILHPGVRVGQDGFGFIRGSMEKIPQIGRVVIQDGVEIGANSCIDRGSLGDTIIGEGTKIDNLVQIGHNVTIGRQSAIAAQCGISGSVTLGDRVVLAGQVGMADHLSVGDRAIVGAQSGVMHNVPAGETWFGYPAQPIQSAMREIAKLRSIARSKKKKQADD